MRLRKFMWVSAAASGLLATADTVDAGDPGMGIRHNLPPAQRLMEPGPMVGGPGPGVLMPETLPAGGGAGGLGMLGGPPVQVLFDRPQSMQLQYDSIGDNTFQSDPLVAPARLEFGPGGIYRLKLTNIQGREGVELYPTLEIAPGTARTGAYLAHNAIPIQFTEEDFEQAISGNFVTKVIYLPDPAFQGDALAGIDTLVSTRLEPGLDPIVEADRRGSILAIIRLGNKDVEMSGPSVAGAGFYGPGGYGPAGYGPGGMQGIGPDGMPCGPGAGMGGAGACGPGGSCMGGGGLLPYGTPANPYGNPPNMVAGVTAPQYGLTHSGTPIGLPGPPHIPLGVPAGLQQHVMKNHTHMHIPDPVEKMKMHVRSIPGQSYPEPPSRMHLREQNIHPGYPTGRPLHLHHSQAVGSGEQYGGAPATYGANASGGEAYCPPTEIR
ncbi:MAG: hypothetical protein ACKN81_16005 [Pirellulaceae bacterium]